MKRTGLALLVLLLVGTLGCYELEAGKLGPVEGSGPVLYRLNRITGEICGYQTFLTFAAAAKMRSAGVPEKVMDDDLTSSEGRQAAEIEGMPPRWCFK